MYFSTQLDTNQWHPVGYIGLLKRPRKRKLNPSKIMSLHSSATIQWQDGEHLVYQDNLYRIRPDGLYDIIQPVPREMLSWLSQFTEASLLTYLNK